MRPCASLSRMRRSGAKRKTDDAQLDTVRVRTPARRVMVHKNRKELWRKRRGRKDDVWHTGEADHQESARDPISPRRWRFDGLSCVSRLAPPLRSVQNEE